MNDIDLKLNKPMAGYEAGRTVTVQADPSGVPLDRFWRRRIKDAKIDNCLEVIKPSKPKSEKAK